MISDATMSSPLFVPDSLKFYVNRLSFSKNRVRLQALSSTTAKSGSQVIVRLPSNTLVNLASLTMTGAVRAYFDGTPASTDGVALPTNWDFSFIETLSLIANGGIITQPFVNYKLLGTILNDINGNALMDQKRSALQGSLPQPLQNRGSGAPDSQGGWQPFSINNWISATQTMAPSYLSTNLLGDLELRLTMADNSVVQSGKVTNGDPASVSTAAWEMKNINFYIETAAIGNNLVDQAVAAKLAAGEPINVPFENVFSFSQSNGGGTFNQRFSVSSQSVNKILVTTQLDTDIATSGQKKFVNGIPQALRRNYNGATQAQFSVNNQYSPNYQIDSGNDKMWNPMTGNNTDNMQMSNALVETRAAMDIPDYDYECADQLCSVPQMPMEFFGTGDVAPSYVMSKLQPGSRQLYQDNNVVGSNINLNTVTNLDNVPLIAYVTGLPATGSQDLADTQTALSAACNADVAPGDIGLGIILNLRVDTSFSGLPDTAKIALVQGSSRVKNANSFWYAYEHKLPLYTYFDDKYVVATSFDFDVADKDRLVSGINTLGSNAQMFYNQIGFGNDKCTSTVFVLCTSMVQIYAGATLKIVQ
jgi:hypothetical protein